jgi:hypothetical protein
VPLELQEDGQFCSMVQQNFLRESCHACRTEREEKRSADSYRMCMRAANSVEKHSADSYRMCMRAADSVAWTPWLGLLGFLLRESARRKDRARG